MQPFVSFEGCDGAGKTTLRKAVVRALKERGIAVFAVGQHSWLDIESSRVIAGVRSGRAMGSKFGLMEAYRRDKHLHYWRNVEPALNTCLVVADRWSLSDAVYHEVLYGVPAEETLKHYWSDRVPLPDWVIYVHVPVEIAYGRILQRAKHRRHYERPAELAAIQAVYMRLLGDESPFHRCKTVSYENSASLGMLETFASHIATLITAGGK